MRTQFDQFGLHGNPIKKLQLIVSAANRVTPAAIMPLIRHLAKRSLPSRHAATMWSAAVSRRRPALTD
jgi:hypothetical protein